MVKEVAIVSTLGGDSPSFLRMGRGPEEFFLSQGWRAESVRCFSALVVVDSFLLNLKAFNARLDSPVMSENFSAASHGPG